MSKTLQEMQIEVASYWSVAEEMNNCPWWLVIERPIPWPGLLIEDARQVHTRIINCADEDGEVDHEYWEREFSSDQFCQRLIHPYLQIEDGNPWSSAAILSRCGKESQSVVKFLGLINQSKHEGDLFNKETYLIWSATEGELLRSWRAGNLVLYYNIALQWLHKYAPEVWAKGMEALR